MQIPKYPRVIYSHKPLISVGCQFDFPSILQVDAEPPFEFQNRIRTQYPEYSQVEQAKGIRLPDQLISLGLRVGNAAHRFSDLPEGQEKWAVSLTKTSLSLVTTDYERWEEFGGHMREALDAFSAVYDPAYFSRIGLRYQNAIELPNIGLEDVPWKELISPDILGLLRIADPESEIEEEFLTTLLVLSDDRKVRLQRGPGYVNDRPAFLIDNDIFTQMKVEVANAYTVLNSLHDDSGRLFRWSISDRLHEALGPNPV
jgi:uncharacterized protein (TIGR04255 family)